MQNNLIIHQLFPDASFSVVLFATYTDRTPRLSTSTTDCQSLASEIFVDIVSCDAISTFSSPYISSMKESVVFLSSIFTHCCQATYSRVFVLKLVFYVFFTKYLNTSFFFYQNGTIITINNHSRCSNAFLIMWPKIRWKPIGVSVLDLVVMSVDKTRLFSFTTAEPPDLLIYDSLVSQVSACFVFLLFN